MKRTKNEEWIIAYLKDKDYVSPSVIGLEHARTFGYRGAHHSCWASPICLSYLQTDDSFPEWRYGPEKEYQEEIRQLKAEIAKLKICLDESKQREEIARKVIDDKNREIEKLKLNDYEPRCE